MKKMVEQEIIRRGPWTEQEDFKLMYFVNMLGDRRWDFIAKVSGLKVAGDSLNRTGKSCRLRWVNYLQPDLKRGKLTPQEEHLVMELHSKWGNRWSRIARKLPGRTDNEIKNYWRTHMRKKKAQEKKRGEAAASASPVSSSCQSSLSSSNPVVDSHASKEGGEESFYDTGGYDDDMMGLINGINVEEDQSSKKEYSIDDIQQQSFISLSDGGYMNHMTPFDSVKDQSFHMDDIWKDIVVPEENINLEPLYEGHSEEGCNFSCPPPMLSPSWEYSSSLWVMDEEESNKVLFPTISDQYFSYYDHGTTFLTG